MSLTKYLIVMFLATILSLTALYIVIHSVNPLATNLLGFVLFYISLFFAITGVLSLFGFCLRYIFQKNQFITHAVLVSFRQAVLLAILVIVSLYLQSQNLVAWWNLLILICILMVIEYGFSKKD